MNRPVLIEPNDRSYTVIELDCDPDRFIESQDKIRDLVPQNATVWPFFYEEDEACHLSVFLPNEYAEIADQLETCVAKTLYVYTRAADRASCATQ